MKTDTTVHELVFATAPRDQGQIVTYSTARTRSGAVIVRRYDASDRSLHYYWKAKPSGQDRLTAKELARYGLVERN